MIDNGTTTGLVFATAYPVSVEAFFKQALRHNIRMISGKALMDRNVPKVLRGTPASAHTDRKPLIEKWYNKGRPSDAVTPRVSPTSTDKEQDITAHLLHEYPDVNLPPLAENKQEAI